MVRLGAGDFAYETSGRNWGKSGWGLADRSSTLRGGVAERRYRARSCLLANVLRGTVTGNHSTAERGATMLARLRPGRAASARRMGASPVPMSRCVKHWP